MLRYVTKRFSLRALLAGLTIICSVIGWYVVRSQNQRACVNKIIKNGGEVVYSYRYPNGKFNNNATPPGLKWLNESLGIDYFDQVYGVDFSNSDISELPSLRHVSAVRVLWLSKTKVVDLDFASELSELEKLWIADTQIESLVPISQNKKLKWLGIEGSKIQDLAPLNELKELRILNITRTNVPPEEVERFRTLNPKCKILSDVD